MDFFSALFRYRDKKSPDKLGLYPEKYHIKTFPERRYLWTARVLVITAALNFCITILLGVTVFLLLPAEKSQPVLYRENDDVLYKISPQTISVSVIDLLNEMHIREYIELRHSFPDRIYKINRQWGEKSKFYFYSSKDVYTNFQNTTDLEELKKLVRKKIKRSIDIKQIKQLSHNFYTVRYNTITTTPQENGSTTTISKWRAYLRVGYTNIVEDAKSDATYLNPYGFKVLNYSFNYIGKE